MGGDNTGTRGLAYLSGIEPDLLRAVARAPLIWPIPRMAVDKHGKKADPVRAKSAVSFDS